MPPLAQRRRLRLTPAQTTILEQLADQPEPCSVNALAAMLHQHPNTVREHLDALVAANAARRNPAPAVGRGRPAWLYETTTAGRLSDDAQEYASLASALAAHIARTSPDPAADADAAGIEWGRSIIRAAAAKTGALDTALVADASPPDSDLRARRRVVALFDELGFSPEADDGATVVRLRRCPLLSAAHHYPEVVCGVHLGMVRGALDELGAPSAGLALRPFAERGACLLYLAAECPVLNEEGTAPADECSAPAAPVAHPLV